MCIECGNEEQRIDALIAGVAAARDVHLQRQDQPALQMPVCGTTEYEHTTSVPGDVTCLVCMAWAAERGL